MPCRASAPRARSSRVRSSLGAQLDLVGIEAVAGVSKAGERRRYLENPCHPYGIEGPLHVEALAHLDVDDLVGRRRRNVNASADEWHQQEFLDVGSVEVERHDV